jgi:DNA-binding NarL/FixJ family response regulator
MAAQQAHILIIDDHPELVEELLPIYGYRVSVVTDGRQAMATLTCNLESYDLILLDVMMPHLDGWEVLRHLRSTPEGQRLPVIMLSALEGDLDQVSGLTIGADDYVVKPFKIPNLLARIEALLRRSRWKRDHQREDAADSLTAPESGQFMVLPIRPVNRTGQTERKPAETIQPLTEREQEILTLLATGRSNREIAEFLVVSELTVKTHLKNLFKKLKVSSRTQAIVVGLQHHLIRDQGSIKA